MLVASLLVDLRVLGNIPRHGSLLFIEVDCQIFSHCSKTENCQFFKECLGMVPVSVFFIKSLVEMVSYKRG